MSGLIAFIDFSGLSGMAWPKKELQNSACCDRRLSRLRKMQGMTQADLAARAGYSVRLISKAEGGNPIAIPTLEDIAEALSTDESRITVQDLVSSPLEMGRQFIFGMYQYQAEVVSTLAEMIHSEITVRFAGDPAEIPFAGQYAGRDEVDGAFRLFFRYLQSPKDHDPVPCYQFIAEGNRVVCWGESWFHPRGGPEMETPVDVSILMQFQKGKLVHLDDRFNTALGSKVINEFLSGKSSA